MLNPNRLLLARKVRGMTKVALSEVTGISAKSITAYETQEQEPFAANIERLARGLRFPAAFLTGPDIEELPSDAASFRAFSNLTVRQQEQAWGTGTLAFFLSDWLTERFRLPDPDVPRYQGVDPETAAQAVREEWGLGERPIKNMIHLLESHGARVFSLPDEISSVDAFSLWRSDTPYVFLSTDKSAERSRMDAAHELGHLVMHGRHERSRGRDVEHEAMSFGGAFLMPEADLKACLPMGGTLRELVLATKRWNVSIANLVYRLHSLSSPLITEWTYRTMFKEISRRGYRKDEPRGSQRETSQVLTKALKSLRADGMTHATMAAELGVSQEDLNALMFGLVLTLVEGGGETPQLTGARPDLRIV